MSKLRDVTGQKFGKLTVVERVISNTKETKWKCICDCGNIVIRGLSHLTRPGNHSCGCLSKTEHPNFKGNEWCVKDDVAIGKDARDNEFYVDIADMDVVSKHRWSGQDKSSRRALGGIYFTARMSRTASTGNKMKMLQNFIWELHNGKIPDGYRVDHINTKPYDNRYSNLRLANKSVNAFNAQRVNKVSNCGIVGVMKIEDDAKYHAGRYRAYISYGGKRHELGYYKNIDDAIIKRLKSELEHFGEICPNNRELYKEYEDRVNG